MSRHVDSVLRLIDDALDDGPARTSSFEQFCTIGLVPTGDLPDSAATMPVGDTDDDTRGVAPGLDAA